MKLILNLRKNYLYALLFHFFLATTSICFAQPPPKAKIGDIINCGVVFYVEDSASLQRILVCAFTDQAASIRWHNGAYIVTRAAVDGLFDENNSKQIINVQGNGSYAATVARTVNYSLQNIDTTHCRGLDTLGWYLPSKAELLLMHNNLSVALKTRLKFAKEGYWSSLELNSEEGDRAKKAWIVDFLNGRAIKSNKANRYHVRAVKMIRRSF
jgi:hypothetical protein